MAIMESDVIVAYISGIGRGPTQTELSEALASGASDAKELFTWLRSNNAESYFNIPTRHFTLALNIITNWTGMDYNQANKWVDALYEDLEAGTVDTNDAHIQFLGIFNNIELDISGIYDDASVDSTLVAAINSISTTGATISRMKGLIRRKYNEAYTRLNPEYSMDEEGNLIDSVIRADASISVADITSNVTVTEGIVTGSGVFDKIMETVNAHINNQYQLDRLTGSDFATVYSNSLNAVLQLSFNFVVNRAVSEEGIKLTRANVDLTKRKTI